MGTNSRNALVSALGLDKSVTLDDCDLMSLATARIRQYERLLAFHPRAAKLMRKKKNFLVVACDETYFPVVYEMIRYSELHKGRWTKEDQELYDQAMEVRDAEE